MNNLTESAEQRNFIANSSVPKRGRPPGILTVEILLPFKKQIIIRAVNVNNFWVVRCLA